MDFLDCRFSTPINLSINTLYNLIHQTLSRTNIIFDTNNLDDFHLKMNKTLLSIKCTEIARCKTAISIYSRSKNFSTLFNNGKTEFNVKFICRSLAYELEKYKLNNPTSTLLNTDIKHLHSCNITFHNRRLYNLFAKLIPCTAIIFSRMIIAFSALIIFLYFPQLFLPTIPVAVDEYKDSIASHAEVVSIENEQELLTGQVNTIFFENGASISMKMSYLTKKRITLLYFHMDPTLECYQYIPLLISSINPNVILEDDNTADLLDSIHEIVEDNTKIVNVKDIGKVSAFIEIISDEDPEYLYMHFNLTPFQSKK